MKIELFYSPGCKRCEVARAELKAAAAQALADVSWTWTELDVLEHLDYAVELSVLTLPAIAIEADLVNWIALPLGLGLFGFIEP